MTTYNSAKQRRFVHSPFTLEHMGVKVSVAEDGKITLICESIENELTVEDEVVIPASLIFKLAKMLEATRKIHYIDKE